MVRVLHVPSCALLCSAKTDTHRDVSQFRPPTPKCLPNPREKPFFLWVNLGYGCPAESGDPWGTWRGGLFFRGDHWSQLPSLLTVVAAICRMQGISLLYVVVHLPGTSCLGVLAFDYPTVNRSPDRAPRQGVPCRSAPVLSLSLSRCQPGRGGSTVVHGYDDELDHVLWENSY